MDDFQIAVNREVGVLPLSIGTALAFEPLLQGKNLKRFNVVLVNVNTIIRNYYASIKNKMAHYIHVDVAASVIIDEMNLIREQCGTVPVEYYSSTYSDIRAVLPGANIRQPHTDKQIFDQQQEQETLMAIAKQGFVFRVFDRTELSFPQAGHALMFSHLPIDLFVRYDFNTLTLLESYTGRLKTRDEWQTKLTNGKELKRMPFNKFTLALFGDNGGMIAPQAISLRRAVLELSEVFEWTTITGMEKIKANIKTIKDQDHATRLLEFAGPYV